MINDHASECDTNDAIIAGSTLAPGSMILPTVAFVYNVAHRWLKLLDELFYIFVTTNLARVSHL